jgi:hypothetical protein
MAGTYYQAVAEGQRSGQAGRVVPSGTGRNITYRFVSSGGGGGGSGRGGINYSSLYADFQKRETGAREANVARETEIRGIYDEAIGQGQGAFRTAGLADIERSKTRAVGQGTQQLISSGLYGTTTAASIPVQAENQAALSRLKLEDIIQQRTTELKLGKAGFVERIEDPYPDYNQLIQAMAAGASR